METLRVSSFSPQLSGAKKLIASANPRRKWLFVQGISASCVWSVYFESPSSEITAVLPTQYSSFMIDALNMWKGDVYLGSSVDGLSLAYVTEVSE